MSFKNLDQEYTFEKNESGFINKATQQQVAIAHRLIVKTSKKINNKKLSKADKAITEVKELYQAKEFNYFLAEVDKAADLQKVMVHLAKNKSIQLVQPDILQQTEKTHQDHEPTKNPLTKPLKKPKNKLQQQLNREKQRANALPRYLKFIGVDELWKNTKGKGVKIAVIDDGFDLTHDEFKELTTNFSYDATQQTLDTSPKDGVDTHGTKIAGVLFAKHNDKGVEGIAPEAEYIAERKSVGEGKR